MSTITLPKEAQEAAKKLPKYFVFYPDFPKPGINFWDVFSLLKNREAFDLFNTVLAGYAKVMTGKVDVVVGIEARGFLFGPLLANYLGCSFVPVRKKGKLPGKTKAITYTIEYGSDTMEIQDDSVQSGQKVLIVDDCLATGGTLSATCELIISLGAEIVDCLVIYRIPDVPESGNIPASVTTLCRFV
ncbi:hypothetical protein V9T40_001531 [Parthenolecanium corni]|uniref:Adenine phosphoribosyltransferase n=1 Tax=Parthenolecanium corni TaxID=536013 RepID=A0AAN9TYC9_9HEMI